MIMLSGLSGLTRPSKTARRTSESQIEVDFSLKTGALFPSGRSHRVTRDGGVIIWEVGEDKKVGRLPPRVTSGDDYKADVETDLTLPRSF